MRKRPSEHEEAVFGIVGALLNAHVEPYDDGSEPGMWDATIEYSNGRGAALEVTRVIDGNDLKLERFAESPIPLSGPNDWLLFYPMTVQIRELLRYGPALVARCEAANVTDLWSLPDVQNVMLMAQDEIAPEIKWCLARQVRLMPVAPNPNGCGQLYLNPEGVGGAIRRDLPDFEAWITAQTREPWFTPNVEKLARSGFDELHLAVTLHASGVPGDLYMSFSRAESISPTVHIEAGPLTDLWLIPLGAPVVVHWSTDDGWALLRRPD